MVFKKYVLNFEKNKKFNSDTNLGTIFLEEDVAQLKDVVVIAEKSTVVIKYLNSNPEIELAMLFTTLDGKLIPATVINGIVVLIVIRFGPN